MLLVPWNSAFACRFVQTDMDCQRASCLIQLVLSHCCKSDVNTPQQEILAIMYPSHVKTGKILPLLHRKIPQPSKESNYTLPVNGTFRLAETKKIKWSTCHRQMTDFIINDSSIYMFLLYRMVDPICLYQMKAKWMKFVLFPLMSSSETLWLNRFLPTTFPTNRFQWIFSLLLFHRTSKHRRGWRMRKRDLITPIFHGVGTEAIIQSDDDL